MEKKILLLNLKTEKMETLKINDSPIVEVEPVPEVECSDGFILSNTKKISFDKLRKGSIIPVFAKDNESTISHPEFIESVQSITEQVFSDQRILKPAVRVSHPVKGRTPEAMGKPANMLRDHEKTLYYERMAFAIDLPEIQEDVNGNALSLTIGGVRAYT